MSDPTSPNPESISGREDPGDGHMPVQALAQFYRAFNGRDLDAAERCWETSAEAVMDNPLGGISRGWPAIRAVYARLFDGPNRISVEFWDYTILTSADVFVAIGRERGRLEPAQGAPLDLAIRTSRVFRRDGQGEWRQIHHHGSIDDPDLLRAYQKAVRG